MALNTTTGLLNDPLKLNAPVIAPITPITAAGANTTNAVATTMAQPTNISTATSAGGLSTAQTRDLNGNELLSNNVNNLIDANSPLMQQAATRAKQQANGSGLLNSSMAVGAAQGAVMDKAITIGQGDAATYTNNLDRNLANEQSSNVLNANNTQQNNQFNANATNTANEFNATATNDANKYNSGLLTQTSATNAQAANANAQFNANATNATAQYNETAKTDINKANADLAMKIDSMNLDTGIKVDLANLDTKTKLDMADIEANYKTLMQADASLGTMYTQMIKNITDISSNKDMDATAKQAATDLQTNSFKTYANMTAAMNNLNIDTLLNFGQVTATNTSPATTAIQTTVNTQATAPATLAAGSAGLPKTNLTDGQVVNVGGVNYQLTGYKPAQPATPAQPAVYGNTGILANVPTRDAQPAKAAVPEVAGTWTKL